MRKLSILLLLVVVTLVSTVGCAKTRTRCRNLFRRGVPCCGTARATPAVIGAPVAVPAPATAPAPIVQQVIPQPAPQMIVPQMMAPPVQCCPQIICPPCNPCQIPCNPCDPCGQGGYIGGGVITEGCQDCGPITTYEQGYIEAAPQGQVVDPGPVTGGN